MRNPSETAAASTAYGALEQTIESESKRRICAQLFSSHNKSPQLAAHACEGDGEFEGAAAGE